MRLAALAPLALTACTVAEDALPIDGGHPTWHQDIAPLLSAHCSGCHREGGLAPFSLTSYDDAAPIANLIAAAVASGEMPPWGAPPSEECEQERPWKGDVSLSPLQVAQLRAWADDDAPLGDPATAAALPPPPEEHLANPTQRVAPSGAYTVEANGDEFRCVKYDPQIATDQWLTGVEVIPDALQIAHHAVVYLDTERESLELAGPDGTWDGFSGCDISGSAIGGWVPGSAPIEFPDGSGIEMPANSLLVVQYHFYGIGTPVPDATQIDLRYTAAPPEKTVTFRFVGNAWDAASGLLPGPNDRYGTPEFHIPADEPDHIERVTWTVPLGIGEVRLFTVLAHMHLLGTSLSFDVVRAFPAGEPANECLLDASRYDFAWQRFYTYDVPLDELPVVQGGDTLRVECHFDNSLGNEALREALAREGLDEPVDVTLGESTLDEMCLAGIGVVY
jgi:hypothetical protein